MLGGTPRQGVPPTNRANLRLFGNCCTGSLNHAAAAAAWLRLPVQQLPNSRRFARLVGGTPCRGVPPNMSMPAVADRLLESNVYQMRPADALEEQCQAAPIRRHRSGTDKS